MLFRHRRGLVWATAIAGTVVSAYLFHVERSRESSDFAREVRTAAHDRAESIRRELDLDLSALRGLAAFLKTGQSDRKSFDVVASHLIAGYPSVRALEWSPKTEHGARKQFEARNFPILEGNPAQPRPAAERPLYYPIEFLYPVNQNRTAFGFDLASSPGCREAQERAAATGLPALTEKYPILEKTKDGYGVLAFMPVHQAAGPGGFVAALLQVADLVERGLHRFETSRLNLYVFDRDAAGAKQLLHAPSGSPVSLLAESDVQRRLSVTIPMEIGGRRWAFVFEPMPAYLAMEHGLRPWALLLIGLAFTAIAVFYLHANQIYSSRTHSLLATVELANAELEKARDDALEALRAKSLFLANLSHEVRTPLNGVLGMTELVLQGQLSAEQRELLEISQQSGKNLLMLLNDVLDFAKGVANKLTVESFPFDVRQELEPMLRLYANTAESNRLGFDCSWDSSVPQWIRGDPTRLRQIVSNLVTNSLKFTETGHISVAFRTQTDTSGALHLILTVEDTGIGISRKALANIFSPFVQADGSTTRKYGGTGLGLAITKQLVALMNGDIAVQSKPGFGSLFTVRIRVEAADAPQQDVSPQEECSYRKGARVLVAEDNEVNRRLLTRMLERLGCSVEAVENGRDAVERYRSRPYDLVLMDCQMPGLDGYDAVAQIRRRDADTGAPVIAVTADASQENRERCQAAGMNDYMTKPASIAMLVDVLNRWVPDNEPAQSR